MNKLRPALVELLGRELADILPTGEPGGAVDDGPEHGREETLRLMSRHAAGLNWLPMAMSFARFFESEWVGMRLSKEEIRQFLQTRNALAHRASFVATKSTEMVIEFRRLIHLLDRVILALLRYEGSYVDFENFTRAVMARSISAEPSVHDQVPAPQDQPL